MRSRVPSNRKNARARNRARFLAPARLRRAHRFLETDAPDDGARFNELYHRSDFDEEYRNKYYFGPSESLLFLYRASKVIWCATEKFNF